MPAWIEQRCKCCKLGWHDLFLTTLTIWLYWVTWQSRGWCWYLECWDDPVPDGSWASNSVARDWPPRSSAWKLENRNFVTATVTHTSHAQTICIYIYTVLMLIYFVTDTLYTCRSRQQHNGKTQLGGFGSCFRCNGDLRRPLLQVNLGPGAFGSPATRHGFLRKKASHVSGRLT